MEKKRQHLQLAVHEHASEDPYIGVPRVWCTKKGMSHFYKAFASLDRAEGICHLICIWKENSRKKSILAHHYLLHFNALGIKEYRVEDITGISCSAWLDGHDYKMVEIELAEAAGLILDAYIQNRKFKSLLAPGIDDNYFIFQYAEERNQPINQRLLTKCQNIRMFINIYIAALRRMDSGLIYDLSARDRQRKLGERLDYLHKVDPELSHWTFISTEIVSVQEGASLSRAHVDIVVVDQEERIFRISYALQIIISDEHYNLLDIQEIAREQLHLLQPQNPLNYRVYTVLFQHKDTESVKKWLNQQANIFLAGERERGEQYKWLVGGSAPWEEYCFSQAIAAEFYLTDQELLVYCQRPENLASINRLVTEDLPDKIELKAQYYLDNSELLHKICVIDGQEESNFGKILNNKRALSFLCILPVEELSHFREHIMSEAEKTVKLGHNFHYHFISYEDVLLEIYSLENYQWVTVYCDPHEKMLSWLKENFTFSDIIQKYEFEDYYDLFTPPLTEQRKWEIFQQLLHIGKEAGYMRKMGLVPSVKEAATQYGMLI